MIDTIPLFAHDDVSVNVVKEFESSYSVLIPVYIWNESAIAEAEGTCQNLSCVQCT